MTPNKIILKNFRKIPAVEIDLTGISLASIVGANAMAKALPSPMPRYLLYSVNLPLAAH